MTPQRKLLDALNLVKDSLPTTLDERFYDSVISQDQRESYLSRREKLLEAINSFSGRLVDWEQKNYQTDKCAKIYSEQMFEIFSREGVEFGVFLQAIKALLSDLQELTVDTKSKLFCY